MGKSVLKGLKYRAETLLKEMPEKFGQSFEKNKTALDSMSLGLSKESRNIVAGYMVRLSKKEE